MRKLKLFYVLITGLTILSSCSNSDESNNDLNSSNDIIIGKWRAIEKYESNQIVELPICLPHIYTEYNTDKSVSGDRIISDSYPDECNLLEFNLGIVWNNLGNNYYQIGAINEQGTTYKLYKDGINLVEENSNGTIKIIYEPY